MEDNKRSAGLYKFVSAKMAFQWKRCSSFAQTAAHFLPHIRQQSGRLFLSLAAGIGYVFFGLIEPWPMKLIFDNVFLEEPLPKILTPLLTPYLEDKFQLLYILIGSIICIALIRGLFYYYQQILTSRSGQQIIAAVRVDLYSHLQRLSFSFHDKRRTGDMLARLTTDIRIMRDIFVSLPLTATSDFLMMVSMVAVMAYMDLGLTLIALTAIPILMLLVMRYRLPMKRAMHSQREREGHLTSIASEVLGAIKVVQGFHQEPNEVERFTVQNKGSLKSGLRATRLEAKLKWASECAVAIVTAFVLGVAGQRVLTGIISPGDLLVFAFYLRTFNRPLRRISKSTELMARGTASGERILDLMRISPEIQDHSSAKEAPRMMGKIRFENVYFGYKTDRFVLKNINLTIKPKERLAIVGRTGSGKTTLVSMIPRFYPCNSGRVLIDETEITAWTLKSLRRQISIVFQEPVLFATSVAENIAYGKPEASMDEIITAAKRVGIHEIIESLPEGYDTVIGERGGTLSGGQRQCVAIARSMMKNAPIVILDEPLTGLDKNSATLVMNALNVLMEDKTVILITHQLEAVGNVDRVIKISKGEIVIDNDPVEDKILAGIS